MALTADEVPAAVEQIKNYFSYMYSLLSKTLHDARRCSERFKSLVLDWRKIRNENLKELSAMMELIRSKSEENLYRKVTPRLFHLRESIRADQKAFQNLLSILDEYLKHAADIKHAFEEAKANNVSGIVVSIVKAELPGEVLEISSATEEEPNLYEIVPLLRMINVWSLGKIDSVNGIIEILNYLSCQWWIIEELNRINVNKGPVCDIGLFPDKFLEDSPTPIPTESLSYYDLVTNLSVGSYAESILTILLNLREEELLSTAENNYEMVYKLWRAMKNRTHTVENLTELLIAET